LVVERSLHFFKIQRGSKVEVVSTHRLKPCHAPQDVQAAEPPRRGRPPNAVKGSVSRQPSCLSAKVLPPVLGRRRVSQRKNITLNKVTLSTNVTLVFA
jgi:hypothetical protein